jgi:cell division protein FtsW (lipid II flippase)
LGGGLPQLVPVAESDFIISSLGEELGLAGLFCIFVLYLLFVSRGIRIAFNHTDDFSKLLATGLSFVVALQTFIVIGGVTRVVPLTGLTTPFLAAGGSSLLANWVIVALLLRVSDSAGGATRAVNL